MKPLSYTLSNAIGDSVTIVNYGARLHQWATCIDGVERKLITSYASIDDYLADTSYMGAIAGPYANRIANAQVTINQKQVLLEANEGHNLLHGGLNALESHCWQVISHNDTSITLTTEFADGKNGFPGPITFIVTYLLLTTSELIIKINATSQQTTIIGPTGHAYFNLSGQALSIKGHKLKINADEYTNVDHQNIPTGMLTCVKGSYFDFTTCSGLNAVLDIGLDHNFALRDSVFLGQDVPAAELVSPQGDVVLNVYTNYPGLQVYDGRHLSSPFVAHQGLCLEPQFYPDAPNHNNFPFDFTSPNAPFERIIRYQLNKVT